MGTPLTWFAGDGLDWERQLGVRSDRERLVAGGEGRNHDIGHVDLLEGEGTGAETASWDTAAGAILVPGGCRHPCNGNGDAQSGVSHLYLDLLLQEVDFVLLLNELLLLLGDLAGGRRRGSAQHPQ